MKPNAAVLALGLAATLAIGTGTPAVAASDGARVSAAKASRGGHARADSHRSRPRHDGRSHGSRVYVRPWGWSIGWGPYWSGFWDPGFYYYGPGWGYPRVYPQPGAIYGALDFDVSPERAEIWVDGRRIGIADDYDGFPDYLWLEKGTYDVVVYLPGYRTIARQYTIYPGLVIDVEDRMERGESVAPLDLVSKSHERRDERLRRDEENRRRIDERSTAPGESYRNPPSPDWIDARAEPGRLQLVVEPADASVYLDGRFVGTGREIAGLRAGLLVDVGTHRLEIVRPGYSAETRTVEVRAGDDSELRVVLREKSGGPS